VIGDNYYSRWFAPWIWIAGFLLIATVLVSVIVFTRRRGRNYGNNRKSKKGFAGLYRSSSVLRFSLIFGLTDRITFPIRLLAIILHLMYTLDRIAFSFGIIRNSQLPHM